MRIKMLQIPGVEAVDGIDLQRFLRGQQYDVGHVLGALLLAEGWAEPIASDEPALPMPASEFPPDGPRLDPPPNLVREIVPPYYDGPSALGTDRRRRRRAH